MSLPPAAGTRGTLHKRRGGFGKHMFNAWQPRHFQLEDGVLRYFEDEQHLNEVRGEMKLTKDTVQFSVGGPVEGAPSRFTIQIDQREGERWKMCADSQEDMLRWAEALEAHASRVLDTASEPPASPSGGLSSPSILRGKQMHAEGSKSPMSATSAASPSAAAASAAAVTSAGGATTATSATAAGTGGPRKRQVKVSAATKKKRMKGTVFTPENVEKALSVFAVNMCFVIVALRYDLTFWVTVAVANALVLRIISKQPKEVPIMKVAAPAQLSAGAAPQTSAAVSIPDTHGASTTRAGASALSNMDGLGATESKVAEETGAGADGIKYKEIDGELYPVAGTTCERAAEGTTAASAPAHTWSEGDATIFQVRSKGYNNHKQKAPSERALMDLVAVDFVKTKYNVNNIGSEVALPDTSDLDTHHPDVPPIFIISWQLPVGQTSMFGTVTDGPGYHAVLYFKIRPEVCDELKDLSTAREAVKLFAEYCKKAPEDPAFRARFKAMAYVDNLDQMGFPSFITKYNAKPVLIRKTGNLIRGPNYLEMDINVHSFAAMAKKGISMLMPAFKDMYINIGFTIEGRDDSELPECLFGCGQLHRPNQDMAIDLFEQPDLEEA